MFDINHLSPSHLKIAQWIRHNESAVMIASEKDIAEATGVSIASVSRFWRMIGCRNLKEYKQKLKAKQEVTPAKKMLKTIGNLEYTDVQSHHLSRSIRHLQATLDHFQRDPFNKAVKLIQESSRLYVYAPGPSISLGELLCYRLRRFGQDARCLRWMGSELLEEMVHIDKSCTVLIFAFGRILKEGEVLLKHAMDTGYKTIVVTDQLVLDTSFPFDVFLYADRGDKDEFHSMIAPLFLLENLIMEMGKAGQPHQMEHLERLDSLRRKYRDDLPR
ncbi:MurR/RpiR family transcriptional regulator [Domibacillus indicus]|uniref:MurR/RpiR family transcriptional regulator n=1 Tax=Domibacillus indicus TaxID=1437523 RepID=UPI0006991598|nr:MurR/RpiR family transcriptional regulator [Domibacillus indicus]